MARQGLGVMRTPLGFGIAVGLQIAGWTCQIFAVYTAMRAFDIHAPLPAAGVVLLVMNVVTLFPFWPGNIGALQLAIAAPLRASYGVATATDRKSTRLNSSHMSISYAVFCLKKKKSPHDKRQ